MLSIISITSLILLFMIKLFKEILETFNVNLLILFITLSFFSSIPIIINFNILYFDIEEYSKIILSSLFSSFILLLILQSYNAYMLKSGKDKKLRTKLQYLIKLFSTISLKSNSPQRNDIVMTEIMYMKDDILRNLSDNESLNQAIIELILSNEFQLFFEIFKYNKKLSFENNENDFTKFQNSCQSISNIIAKIVQSI